MGMFDKTFRSEIQMMVDIYFTKVCRIAHLSIHISAASFHNCVAFVVLHTDTSSELYLDAKIHSVYVFNCLTLDYLSDVCHFNLANPLHKYLSFISVHFQNSS